MNALETELITSLWDGPRTGDELFGVFSSVVGERTVSFQEVIETLKSRTYVEVAGYDPSGDELYRVTETGVEECAKHLHEAEVGKGGKFRKKSAGASRFEALAAKDGDNRVSKDRTTAEECLWFFIVWILAPTCGIYVLAWWIKELNTAN